MENHPLIYAFVEIYKFLSRDKNERDGVLPPIKEKSFYAWNKKIRWQDYDTSDTLFQGPSPKKEEYVKKSSLKKITKGSPNWGWYVNGTNTPNSTK